MPLHFEFTLSSLTLFAIIFLSIAVGFLLRGHQVKNKNIRIARLEKEMMQAYAETLEAQKEYCELESRLKDMKIPVISMKHASKEEAVSTEQDIEAAPSRQNRPTRTA